MTWSPPPPAPPRPPRPTPAVTPPYSAAILADLQHESDPHGLDPHTAGAKLDAGKPLAGLVLGDFARALAAVVEVGTVGAQKYTPSGWLHVPDGQARYTSAMLRHWLAEAAGQQYDADTGLLHAKQTAWNALARLELILRELELHE